MVQEDPSCSPAALLPGVVICRDTGVFRRTSIIRWSFRCIGATVRDRFVRRQRRSEAPMGWEEGHVGGAPAFRTWDSRRSHQVCNRGASSWSVVVILRKFKLLAPLALDTPSVMMLASAHQRCWLRWPNITRPADVYFLRKDLTD